MGLMQRKIAMKKCYYVTGKSRSHRITVLLHKFTLVLRVSTYVMRATRQLSIDSCNLGHLREKVLDFALDVSAIQEYSGLSGLK